MTFKKVSKSKPLRGEIDIPADKSISHRAVMLSSIAKGTSIVKNFSSGKDCHTTLDIFKQLGIIAEFIDKKIIKIAGSVLKAPTEELNCGNSGTTMRLMSAILAGQNFNSVLIGDASLSNRPMKRIIEPLRLMGADISSYDNHAPLIINGKMLHGIDYESKLSSAQVKSSILLAGLKADSKTVYKEKNLSRNHSEIMLKYLGADIQIDDTTTTICPSELVAKDIEIVGDISSAAFFIVAGLVVEGSDFVIRNVGVNPTRTGILDVVRRMGGNLELINQRVCCGEPVADICVKYTETLKACEIGGDDIPRLIDELPVLAVLASQAEGVTLVKDALDLRNKESDRISLLVEGLKQLGASIEEREDGFEIQGKTNLLGDANLSSCMDHRLAMSFYIAGLICKKEILIDGFEWVNISFPEFESLYHKLI